MMNRVELEQKIREIQDEIGSLGPLRPGSIYSRLNVCGRPGCSCAREKDPIKHGPYHYLSYTFRRKSYTEFIRQGTLSEVKAQVETYNRLMELVDQLVEYNIELARLKKKESK
jgi:hypothetical protein